MLKELGLATALSIGGSMLAQACDGGGNTPPSHGPAFIDVRNNLHKVTYGMWGASGNGEVTIICHSVLGELVSKSSGTVRHPGGGDSYNEAGKTRITVTCPWTHPYYHDSWIITWD